MRLETLTHKTINDRQHDALVSLSQYASTLNDPAAKNYAVDDWEERTDTLLYAFYKKKAAAQNPWGEGATTLEWTVPSPPNFHTFDELPKFEDEEGIEKSTS